MQVEMAANVDESPGKPLCNNAVIKFSPTPQSSSSPVKCRPIRTRSSFSTSSSPVTSNPVSYTLNRELALCKKRLACDRTPYEIKQNKQSTTITMNTVTFEIFRSSILSYLKRRYVECTRKTTTSTR